MGLNELTGNERIIAEHAVLSYREVAKATHNAPAGQGMAAVEQVVLEKGFQTLRKMIELGASEHPEAQKRGPRQGLFVQQHPELPGLDPQDLHHVRRRGDGRAAVLRLAVLRLA